MEEAAAQSSPRDKRLQIPGAGLRPVTPPPSSARSPRTLGAADYNAELIQMMLRELSTKDVLRQLVSEAEALMAAIGQLKCNHTAGRLIGLRLQEVLERVVQADQHVDAASVAELTGLIKQAAALMKRLGSPGWLSHVLSGRNVREEIDRIDGRMTRIGTDVSASIGLPALKVRSYENVHNAMAAVIEMGGLEAVHDDHEGELKHLAQLLEANVNALSTEVDAEVAMIRRDTENIIDQLMDPAIAHPGFRRLWARRIQQSSVDIDIFLERLVDYLIDDQGMDKARVDSILGEETSRDYLRQALDLDGTGQTTPSQLRVVLRPLTHFETVYQVTSFLVAQKRRVILPAAASDFSRPGHVALPGVAEVVSALKRKAGVINIFGDSETGKTHAVLSACHMLSRTDSEHGDVYYLDVSRKSAGKASTDSLVSAVSAQLGLSLPNRCSLATVLNRFVERLAPNSVIVVDHVSPDSRAMLEPLDDALSQRTATDLRYVLVSRELLEDLSPERLMDRLQIGSLTPAEAMEASTKLLPQLDAVSRERLVDYAAYRLGRLMVLSKLPAQVLTQLLKETQSTTNLEALLLHSLSHSDREFLHPLGPLFAVESVFEDKLAMKLLGPAARDALERADIWFKLLSLGVARRTDEGLFVLDPRYAVELHTSSSSWMAYYEHWADELAQLGERSVKDPTDALAIFDRWRPHFDMLLDVARSGKGLDTGNLASLCNRASGSLHHLLSRRMAKADLISLLNSLAEQSDSTTRADAAVRARLDLVAYMLEQKDYEGAQQHADEAAKVAQQLPKAQALLKRQITAAQGLALDGMGRTDDAWRLFASLVDVKGVRHDIPFINEAVARHAALAGHAHDRVEAEANEARSQEPFFDSEPSKIPATEGQN